MLDGTAADPQLGMTCAACHTGTVQYRGRRWQIDGGRADADFQKFLLDLSVAARSTLVDPERFTAFAARVLGPPASPAQIAKLRDEFVRWTDQYSSFMTASLPDQPWGSGRLDAFGMIFNRVTGLDLRYPANIQKADAPVRYPFIWDAARQDRTQWTGAAPNGTYLRGLARNTGEVFGVFGRFDPVPIPMHTAIYRSRWLFPDCRRSRRRWSYCVRRPGPVRCSGSTWRVPARVSKSSVGNVLGAMAQGRRASSGMPGTHRCATCAPTREHTKILFAQARPGF